MLVSSGLSLFFDFWTSIMLLSRSEILTSWLSLAPLFPPITSFWTHRPHLSKVEFWGSQNLSAHPHSSSHPEQDFPAYSNPPRSLLPSQLLRMSLSGLWMFVGQGCVWLILDPRPSHCSRHTPSAQPMCIGRMDGEGPLTWATQTPNLPPASCSASYGALVVCPITASPTLSISPAAILIQASGFTPGILYTVQLVFPFSFPPSLSLLSSLPFHLFFLFSHLT